MNKLIFTIAAALTLSFTLSGCVTVAPEEDPVKSEIETLRSESAELTVSAHETSAQVTNLKRKVDGLENRSASSQADIDQLKVEVGALIGVLEERDFEVERIKENLELISETIASVDERFTKDATVDTLGAPDAKEFIELKGLLTELTTAVQSLDKRVTFLEETPLKDKADTKKIEGTIKTDPSAMYMNALELVRVKKNYLQGLEDLRHFLKLFPKHELSDNAQYWIGEIFYGQGDWERAAIEFNTVRERYPKGDKVPGATLKLAFSLEKIGDIESAKTLLNRIIEKYPKSEEAKRAKEHLAKKDGSGKGKQ